MSSYRSSYVDRSGTTSRYGSSYRSPSTTSTPASSYRSSATPRAESTTNSASATTSIREKYAGRTSAPTAEKESDKPAARRYANSTYTVPEAPKSLRFGSTSRFGGPIARSPISEKSPTVFGVSADQEQSKEKSTPQSNNNEKLTVVTRGTSPTPPSNSNYLRSRRADLDKGLERQTSRPAIKPDSIESETQTDEKCFSTKKELSETRKSESEPTPRSTSTWTSRFSSPYTPSLSSTSSSSSRYTPRSTYSTYSRPTDLPLRSTTLSRTPDKESHSKYSTPTPTTTTPTSMSPKDGKDPARFGGFSYARPTDLPNLSPVHKVGSTDFTNETEKCKSVTKHSPLTPEKKIALPGLTPDSPEPAFFNSSPLRSTNDSKLTSPSDTKNRLPPQVPKSDSSKTNKDFRKSVLNMDLSNKNDETRKQNSLSQSKSMGKLAGSQKLPVAKLKQLVISKTITTSSSSEEESSTESTESSSSSEEDEEDDDDDDDDDGDDEATVSPNKPALVKTFTKHLPEKMLVASKTTSHVPVNFSDESSKSCEKPPRPPPSPRPKVMKNDEIKKEEAKATVSRLLGPVSNTTPLRSASSSAEDLSEKGNMNELNRVKSRGNLLLKSGSNSSLKKSASKSSLNKSAHICEMNGDANQNLLTVPDNNNHKYCITKIESGERAWWMQSNSDIPGKGVADGDISRSASKAEISKAESNGDLIRRSASKSGINKSMSRSEMIPKSPSRSEMIPKSPSKSPEMLSRSASKAEILAKSRSRSDLSRSKSRSELLNKSASKANLISRCGSRVDVGGEKSPFKITRIESGERAWWMSSSTDIPGGAENNESVPCSPQIAVRKIDSGEKGWWQQDSGGENTSSGIDPVPKDSSSGDLLEETGSQNDRNEMEPNMAATRMWKMRRMDSGCLEWWLDSDEERKRKEEKRKAIREKPYIGRFTNVDDLLGCQAPPPCAFRTPRNTSSEESSSEDECFLTADQVRIHEGSPPPRRNIAGEAKPGMIKLDDTALQLYKDGDYGSYLDLEASINEQHEEFEDFQTNRKNSIVLRTQLSVRVHTIIEKLMKSEGKELRRSLFSLKQIFQEDKDLVHEFVQNDGLACLIKVGSDADQNYQHYILRALGQVMLYVDGMNGVIEHPGTIQWLYSLVSSKFRSVVKTALKLLLVFVEYVETNCVLLVKAIRAVDYVHSTKPWSNIMKLLKDYDSADTELLIYATTLINKTLNGLPDQDSYYDQVDALEEQGFESIIRRYMSKQGTDLDLLRQFQIYEAVLQHEDGEDKGTPLKQLDEAIRKTLRNRKCLTATLPYVERRKSRRHSTGTSPSALTLNLSRLQVEPDKTNDDYHNERDVGVTPALRRRRERAERQRSFIKEQREASLRVSVSSTDQSGSEDGGSVQQNGSHATQNGDSEEHPVCNGDSTTSPLRRDNTVKDLSQRLASTLNGTDASNMKGLISKAKEGLALAKSQSRGDMLKSPTTETPAVTRAAEVKKSETELHWEELLASTTRELSLCDLDFRDLASDEDRDVLAPTRCSNGIPPPPPPLCGIMPPPAPQVPPGPPCSLAPVPAPPRLTSPIRKQKKTVKLFWKEVREDPLVITKMNSRELIWDELSPVTIDTQKLEHLFESRAKDLITKEKQQELNKNKEIIVLDPKRSNAINIGMTKLPPPRSIKTAILKMDSTVMNREGIEKLLCMLPSEEERSKIQDAQAANPDLPLGSAEQFLLTLASITELPARLKLWAFKLDYENCEKVSNPFIHHLYSFKTSY
ncbi:serine-rich adhesin for platelets isoform X2 [Nilaparvata lugens]|uniref:serine-rich adhesin for platelets isoform X2 n=2 Tax=Nilaparvata lugens TaxID=108931 RepID=UPI00193EAE38|nr:serine-rich adhesin for platelets isoform X2 [Nilaparvata lugens]